MEKYRKKIEKRCRLDGAVCAGVLALYLVLCRFTHTAGGTGKDVALGIVFGLVIVALCTLIRTASALRDEAKLRAMYIEETDERNAAIAKESAQKSQTVSMVGIAAAAIAAGFFDDRICFALAGAVLFSALVSVVMTVYHKKTM